MGPLGKAYGLDMTDEMLAEARKNQAKSGLTNVEFLKGHIEEIPLVDNSVDVIISNCVINLSGDKFKVLREAFRVLKPGGRFAVSDVVLTKPLPAMVQQSLAAWTGCIAGALTEDEYRDKLSASGFSSVEIQYTRIYDFSDADAAGLVPDLDAAELAQASGRVGSAFIRAKKSGQAFLKGDDFIILFADNNDLPQVENLLVSSGLPVEGVAGSLNNFLVAVNKQTLVGVIGMERYGKDILLRSLVVDSAYRKGGIGSALVGEALDQAKMLGGHNIYLLTETARSYMKRWGFQEIARELIPDEILNKSVLGRVCASTSKCMWLKL